jgi:hypothetical protein
MGKRRGCRPILTSGGDERLTSAELFVSTAVDGKSEGDFSRVSSTVDRKGGWEEQRFVGTTGDRKG